MECLLRTQRATKVKIFVGFSLKPLRCRDPALPPLYGHAYSRPFFHAISRVRACVFLVYTRMVHVHAHDTLFIGLGNAHAHRHRGRGLVGVVVIERARVIGARRFSAMCFGATERVYNAS